MSETSSNFNAQPSSTFLLIYLQLSRVGLENNWSIKPRRKNRECHPSGCFSGPGVSPGASEGTHLSFFFFFYKIWFAFLRWKNKSSLFSLHFNTSLHFNLPSSVFTHLASGWFEEVKSGFQLLKSAFQLCTASCREMWNWIFRTRFKVTRLCHLKLIFLSWSSLSQGYCCFFF